MGEKLSHTTATGQEITADQLAAGDKGIVEAARVLGQAKLGGLVTAFEEQNMAKHKKDMAEAAARAANGESTVKPISPPETPRK